MEKQKILEQVKEYYQENHVAKPFDPHRMLAEIARLTRREKEKAQ